ncbi:MAG TPA: hypothetical protein DDY73_02115 [Coprobacter fastidiosus]|uniref:Uncharacterized protein n=1 Tax=Coprobacter fastidiosus TaxID=1099853 RepID=A0A354LZT8_9BACT|nr:hypothetical protein DW107_08125 [Tannerella sp. AM09-19]HBJ07777.1 hypothetical protein [Coprobacter fastidiosus]
MSTKKHDQVIFTFFPIFFPVFIHQTASYTTTTSSKEILNLTRAKFIQALRIIKNKKNNTDLPKIKLSLSYK